MIMRNADDARPTDETLLGWFLHERDVACPRCGYNIRNLTHAFCPECREELALTVRTRGLRLGWFLLALAPLAYAGIIAPIMLADLIYETRVLDRIVTWPWWAAAGVGFACGATSLALLRRREHFLRRTVPLQRRLAMASWFALALLFAVLLALTV
ncbi:MAG TPA: hypothetical protein VMS30_01665 [Phycisphaerales bacterium]|nr:hypothetical protein [Phycisphaerales bacterium]